MCPIFFFNSFWGMQVSFCKLGCLRVSRMLPLPQIFFILLFFVIGVVITSVDEAYTLKAFWEFM